MGFQEIVFLKRFKLGMISFTALLVLICGLVLANTMELQTLTDNPRGPDRLFRPKGGFVERQVASVLPSVLFDDEQEGAQASMTLDLDCSDNSVRPPIAVQTRQLRLRTENCEVDGIRNEKNGFAATVFELGDKRYTSDYISLADGENEIKIHKISPDGTKTLISLRVLSR